MTDKLWHKSDEKPIYHKWVCVKYPNAPVKPVCKFIEENTYISYACEYAYLDDLIAQADKAERLQKAVELAVDAFNEICAGVPSDIWVFDEATKATNEIKQLIKGE